MSDKLRINEICNRLNELKTPEVHALEAELSVLRQEVIYEEDDPRDEFYRSERYLEQREQSERYDDMLDMYSLAGING